ncbi:APC family permease [Thermosynechococcaceae cyanobacterium BACA0444]|uniref:APC family permease n=1 Tax=Pseudocalidococcus azoricus BACA0444 TaxID=2918990 RepID=A0AAE4JXY7_9CYAN|nr:APC family permease [Pseudocalidococcus azoricus]MDS3861568.1 APC family permease [Pseudocalidococcus azoricus BACA0444]
MTSGTTTHLKRSLGFTGILAQSLAGMAPTITPTVNVGIIVLAAGSGTWLTYVVATVAALIIAHNLNVFSRTTASAGALGDYVGLGLGKRGQLITAWALLLAYVTTAMGLITACVTYLDSLCQRLQLGIHPGLLAMGVSSLASVFVLREIRLSTRIMLILEALSVLLVLVFCVLILFHDGLRDDLSQLTLRGVTTDGFNQGLIIAMLSFAGFEAATTLGEEAERPLTTIPKTLVATPIFAGIFFVFSAYVLVLGFHSFDVDLAKSVAPLETLATAMGRDGLGFLIGIGATASLFGCTLATMVGASRLIFAMSRLGQLPQFFSMTARPSSQPRRATLITCIPVSMVGVLSILAFKPSLDLFAWFGTCGTFGFLIAYGLTCMAAPVFLHQVQRLRPQELALGALGFLVTGYILIGSVIPFPPYPMNLAPVAFFIAIILGVGYSLHRETKRSWPG